MVGRGMSWGGQGPGTQLPEAWRCLRHSTLGLGGPPWLGHDSWLQSPRTGSLSGSAGACCVTLSEPLSSLVLGFHCTRRHLSPKVPLHVHPKPLTMGSHDAFSGAASQLGRLALGAQKTY